MGAAVSDWLAALGGVYPIEGILQDVAKSRERGREVRFATLSLGFIEDNTASSWKITLHLVTSSEAWTFLY